MYEFSLAELKLINKDHFAVQFSTTIQIDDPGEYSFSVCSDDGSKLFIDDKMVVDNDGSPRITTVLLRKSWSQSSTYSNIIH